MSYALRFRAEPEPWRNAQPGDCWYYPDWSLDDPLHDRLRAHFIEFEASRQYVEQWLGKRAPIVVYLPPGFAFSPDERYRPADNSNVDRNGWTVTGSPEDLSLVVSPSVNCIGTYHGWINDGQVSADVEGRPY